MKMTQSKSPLPVPPQVFPVMYCTLVKTDSLQFIPYLMLILGVFSTLFCCGFSLSGDFLEAEELFVLCGLPYRLQPLREESEEDSGESKNAE